jgi:hypothetical protein
MAEDQQLPEVSKELKEQARALLSLIKDKYSKSCTQITLNRAEQKAFAIWEKAAAANPRTGAMQLDTSSGTSSMERYFVRFIGGK